jgi:RNA polymerase sigma factor (sigma-70 family)
VANRIPTEWQSVLSANDVLQQTFADAFRAITLFRPNGSASFRTWLMTLARCNLADALKMLRAEKRRGPGRRLALDPAESAGVLWARLTAGEGSPSQFAVREENRELLRQGIAGLPADYQAALTLYDLQGSPIKEVATRLGRSPGAVHMLRARAFDRLRQHLGRKLGFCRNLREDGLPLSGNTTEGERPEP